TRSTLDNRSTYPQIIYLAEVFQATGKERYRRAAERGLDYILREQHSSGGWRGSDVDAITYNDDVMLGVMQLLRTIELSPPRFAWLDDARRQKLSAALQRAIDVTLKCQIRVDGVKTAWCQQHSHKTYAPVAARRYELPAICPVESAGIVQFLMEYDAPSAEMREAIESAVRWIEAVKIEGLRVKEIETAPIRFEHHTATRDRVVVADATAPPLWARYYEIETNRPFFCNRDGKKVYSLAEVHIERRTGYAWYSTAPQALLKEHYPTWMAGKQAR
ncbi:MAG: pectate lyase, partial [Planctomycetales bacterium]|nr:pectate lyase [Planctomycetales bacterium]